MVQCKRNVALVLKFQQGKLFRLQQGPDSVDRKSSSAGKLLQQRQVKREYSQGVSSTEGLLDSA